MSLLTADNLGVSFGAFDLFKGISVSVANDGKIGLIGPNGVGKTTLLLLLAGINQPTSGKVYLARGRRMGYLRQEAMDAFAARDNTVFGEMLTVFGDILARQARLSEMESQMSAGDHSPEMLEEYGRFQDAFDRDGGYEYEIRIQQTLDGLGLGKKHWNMPLNQLSGGQKTRALLARLLLEKPDLLMLDEPTNHLDIEAVEWLEHTLKDWGGAVLIVSHDRYFLDNTVNTIWEMSRTGMQIYSGNYSAYLLQRQERWEYYERVFTEEKARLTNDVDFIQRNWVRASTHARALGLLKRLTRELSIVESYGILALRSGKKWSEYDSDTIRGTDRPLDVIDAIRKVNAISMTSSRPPLIRPRLGTESISGNIILRASNATIGYPGHVLFTTRDLELRRGDCAALIGPNGAGKTTFLKVLLGQLAPLAGEVTLGSSLKIGYFAQAHDGLVATRSVIEELNSHKELEAQEARNHLAAYLFRGEDVFKPVSALSGGERARLALAILTLEGSNFLVLDEPTNHLDIPAQESLQEVLEQFGGTILLVSHDRFLIDRLATQVWELRAGKLEIFRGSYREFILRKAALNAPTMGRQVLLAPKPMLRDNSRETRRKALEMETLEGRIREQESALQRLSSDLQKAADKQAYEKINQISWKVAQAQAALEELMAQWEKLAV
jgi:ATP-binding cassette, subfamily F, member 3